MDYSSFPTGEPVSSRILAAVAEKEGVDEVELETPMYEVIDPDALESLFRDTRGTVIFEYLEYEVKVDHDHTVEVFPLDTAQGE